MQFPVVEKNPWTEEFLSKQLANIGAENPHVTASDVNNIKWSYMQSGRRVYHDAEHGAFVGQDFTPQELENNISENFKIDNNRLLNQTISAVLSIAGLFHDTAYKHVDADDDGKNAWPPVFRKQVEEYIHYETSESNKRLVYTTFLTNKEKEGSIIKMVSDIFGMTASGLSNYNGGNEFDSAIAAAKFLESKKAPPKMIVAVTAAIASTIPFKQVLETDEDDNITGNGFVGELAERVKSVSLDLETGSYAPDWQDVNDIMMLSTYLTNRDLSHFIMPDNFPVLINGGRGVKKEDSPLLRKGIENIQQFEHTAGFEISSPFLYRSFASEDSEVFKAEYVPRTYIPRNNEGKMLVDKAYPPIEVWREAVAHTKQNAEMATRFLEAHQAGIALTAAIATIIGKSLAPVPGIVDSKLWNAQAIPQGETFNNLNAKDQIIYKELMYGTEQRDIDSAITQRSPIGAIIFGALGSDGIKELADKIKLLKTTDSTKSKDANDNEDASMSARAGGETAETIEYTFNDSKKANALIDTIKEFIGPDNFKTIITELHNVSKYYQEDPVRGNMEHPEKLARLVNDELKVYTETKAHAPAWHNRLIASLTNNGVVTGRSK